MSLYEKIDDRKQDYRDIPRPLFRDLLEQLAKVLAVDFRLCGQTSLKGQLDCGLAGRPFHRHEVARAVAGSPPVQCIDATHCFLGPDLQPMISMPPQ